MSQGVKTETITIRVSAALKKRIAEAARAEERSISQLISMMLMENFATGRDRRRQSGRSS